MVLFEQETLSAIYTNGLTSADVMFVATNVSSCSFQEFLQMIKGYTYDNSLELPSISLDLQIIGNGWRLERISQTTGEQWVFKAIPAKQLIIKRSSSVPLVWSIKYSFL